MGILATMIVIGAVLGYGCAMILNQTRMRELEETRHEVKLLKARIEQLKIYAQDRDALLDVYLEQRAVWQRQQLSAVTGSSLGVRSQSSQALQECGDHLSHQQMAEMQRAANAKHNPGVSTDLAGWKL